MSTSHSFVEGEARALFVMREYRGIGGVCVRLTSPRYHRVFPDEPFPQELGIDPQCVTYENEAAGGHKMRPYPCKRLVPQFPVLR